MPRKRVLLRGGNSSLCKIGGSGTDHYDPPADVGILTTSFLQGHWPNIVAGRRSEPYKSAQRQRSKCQMNGERDVVITSDLSRFFWILGARHAGSISFWVFLNVGRATRAGPVRLVARQCHDRVGFPHSLGQRTVSRPSILPALGRRWIPGHLGSTELSRHQRFWLRDWGCDRIYIPLGLGTSRRSYEAVEHRADVPIELERVRTEGQARPRSVTPPVAGWQCQ